MNILGNAIDAIEDAWEQPELKPLRTITIKTQLMEQASPSPHHPPQSAQQWLRISIQNSGRGISEGVRSRIFDPFFTTKPIGQGTGMGLSISYQIITDKHHGRLDCCSVEGCSTEFILTIPVRQTTVRSAARIDLSIDHQASAV